MASGSPASAARSNEPWWLADPVLEEHEGITVVQEHHLAGGSKIRFLPFVVGDAREVVFGGPYCGGAPYALAVFGARTGRKVTLFFAKRKELHWRQKAEFRLGATIYQVPAGRMSVVQHRAKKYARDKGALFLPLGFDVPAATEPFEAVMRGVGQRAGPFDEVWCATGSGMLARCLGHAFPGSRVKGVVVGLKSRNSHQEYPANVELIDCPYDFGQPCARRAPFPCCLNYDAKAWEQLQLAGGARRGRVLFWSVVGDQPQDLEELRP